MTTNSDDEVELKPCPFCKHGGNPKVKHVNSSFPEYPNGYYWVGCEITLVDPNPGCGIGHSKITQAQAVETWNTRTPTPSVAEVARRAAEKFIPDCLSRTCFVKDCGSRGCWGCDDSRVERERLANIISAELASVAPVDAVADECQKRADAVVDAAVEWHQSDEDWFDKSAALETTIDN